MRRRPTAAEEARLAGTLRTLAPCSTALRSALSEVLETFVRRSSFDRPLYSAAIRTLAEAGDKRVGPQIRAALVSDVAGGLPALSAACFCREAALSQPLLKLATCRHAHLAFASEVARLARGEAGALHAASVAPKIKESHRIELCVELFLPLRRGPQLAASIAPGLAVLRDAERHLGRWLVMAEIGARAGDPGPATEARAKAEVGPQSSRAAWALVAWGLDGGAPPADVRPTSELVARLSDRPSSDKDMSFLFRLADIAAPNARAMLEGLARGLGTEVSVRAARCLARGYGRSDLLPALDDLAGDTKREELRGLAAASLWDAGERESALRHAEALVDARSAASQAWAALILCAAMGSKAAGARAQSNGVRLSDAEPLVDEARFRRLHWGWIE